MIESIAITNFYCFKEKTELSFVAGRERNKSLADLFSGFTEQNRVNLLRTVYLCSQKFRLRTPGKDRLD